ncbi:MAG: hypothetical protein ACAI25_20265 [Planctomycetota bacterium]
MGLLSWVDAAADWVGDKASDAWDGITDAAGWVAERWKPIAAALAAGAVFGVVFVLCPPLGPAALTAFAPNLVPGMAAGLLSSITGQGLRDVFSGKTPGTDLILPAVLGVGLGAGGMLLGRAALATPWVQGSEKVAKTIATLTGNGGAVAGKTAAAVGARGTFQQKLGFIGINVTPGPVDIAYTINWNEPASAPPPEPLPATRGFLDVLARTGHHVKDQADSVRDAALSGE